MMAASNVSPLAGIHIVMLGTSDLDAAISFYETKLGLAVQFRSPGFAFLGGGGVTLCLSEPLARASTHLVGATELVFKVASVRDAFRALKDRGVDFVNEPRPVTPTDWAVNFLDPSGHKLSLFGPETAP
jgi:catechol 2,3-dioxygenase-like lactoylglutathione lyase family enzyme